MTFTNRQKYMLSHLHEITYRRKASGRLGYFLQKDDCTSTINSLIVKGVLTREEGARRLKLAEALAS